MIPPGFVPDLRGKSDEDRAAMWGFVPRADLRVLGLWQGAWDAPPDDVLAIQSGRGVRVSVGVGIVVPAQRIIQTLNLPELVEMKKQIRTQIESATTPASLEAAETFAKNISSNENPSHREDFTSLLNAAAKTRPHGGRTSHGENDDNSGDT